MPSELRRISFESEELVEALVDYDRYADQRLACGVVGSVRFGADPLEAIIADVKIWDEPEDHGVALAPEYVGAALVSFCVNRGIPIPRQAQRFLETGGDSVSLCFGLGEDIAGTTRFPLQYL